MLHQERIDGILAERQNDYGDAREAFTAIGRVWGALLKIEDIQAHEVALMLDALKSVRLMHSPDHRDSIDDKFGYLTHYREIVNNDPR